MELPKIHTVIATYNGMKWASKCLGSLRESGHKTSIIVIDNGSTDGSQVYIKKHHPEVDFIQSKENLGFGKSNNIGIKRAYDAGADYVFLLNQDAWVEPNTLGQLVNVAKKNPEYGIISPIHLNGEGNQIDRGVYNYITTMCKNPRLLYSDILLSNIKSIYEVFFINAAAWLITRRCIELVGGFAPIFNHYGEDVNYCHRLIFHDLKIGVVPKSIIFHDRERRKNDKKKHEEVQEFRLILNLVRLLNLNNVSKIDLEIRNLYKRLIKSILLFDRPAIKIFLLELRYLKDFRDAVLDTRAKTVKTGLAFLIDN